MEQFTKETAIKFYESKVWEDMTDRQIVELQLFQKLVCIPFGRFQEAMENVLGRPVYTHEFANTQKLIAEFLGEKQPPTLREILDMIPGDKRMVIFSGQPAN